MKELSYKPCNANTMKIKYAKRKQTLGRVLLFVVLLFAGIGLANADFSKMDKGAAIGSGISLATALPLFMVGGKFKELEGAELTEFMEKATPEQISEYLTAKNAHFKAEIDKAIENKVSKEELSKLVEKLIPDNSVLKEEVIRLATEFKALQEKNKAGDTLDTKGQIKAWAEANKKALESIKAGKQAELGSMVIKLNSPMTPSNTYNSSAYIPQPEFLPGATEIVRVQPTFWDYIKKGRAGSAVLVWVNKKNPEGAAAFIGPGVAKPGVSFEIATETSNAKKVAANEKIATELLEDIEAMASWVQQELAYQVRAKINTTLMSGVSSATVPAGIQTLSVTYSLTTVKTTNPNNWDAIRAAVAQLRSGNLQGPVTAFVNPVDYANMVLTKAVSQGQIFMPAETGATIVEDNNVPVGYVQVALLDYYKVSIWKDFTVTFGFENDDFTKNLVTVIGEVRLHQYFSENHTGAFIYDTFDNIKTALTAV